MIENFLSKIISTYEYERTYLKKILIVVVHSVIWSIFYFLRKIVIYEHGQIGICNFISSTH